MQYLKIEEMSRRWDISPRRLQTLCAEGKIEGALRFGRAWMIPAEAVRPADGRTKAVREANQADGTELRERDIPLPRRTPFLYMSDLYSVPGTADECAGRLAEHHEAQVLFSAEVAYSRGDMDAVYRNASYLLGKHSGFYAVVAGGMRLGLCAIWKGDLAMWRQAKLHIAEAPAKTDADRDILSFSLLALDSMLYDVSGFPDWFQIGRFELLPGDALPAAKVFYAKFLYAVAYSVAIRETELPGLQGLTLMGLLPATIEPMISQAMADRSIISELYLRLTCAAVYRSVDNEAQAVYHIDRAIALALPDGLYGLLAEYCRLLGPLLQKRMDPADWERTEQLYSVYIQGWNRLSGTVRGKYLARDLSPREWEVARLVAIGLRNSEIAEKLHMSMSGVKQTITKVSHKTGMDREEFAAIL